MIAFLFVKTQVPETKGRSLEEIEADLQRKAGVARRRPAPAGAGASGRIGRSHPAR